jgi:hypothetical protein
MRPAFQIWLLEILGIKNAGGELTLWMHIMGIKFESHEANSLWI